MAIKLPSFRVISAGTKTRILLLIMAVVVVGAGVYFATRYLGGEETSSSTQVAAAPAGLQSAPGSQLSPEYYRALAAANAQASRQAQMTGGSAVPTLMNVPQQAQTAFQQPQQQNCTILCPSPVENDVAADLKEMLKSGKVSKQTADLLSGLAKANVPVDEYAAELDRLVREGKLTPEQARQLLEKYKKQHQDALVRQNAAVMDGLIRNGQLSIDTANGLLALEKNGVTPAVLGAELNRAVAAGKLSRAAADAILGQYAATTAREAANQGVFALRQMVKKGTITADVAKELEQMQLKNVPLNVWKDKLNSLVSQGRLTPAVAATLEKSYADTKAKLGASDTLARMIAEERDRAANCTSSIIAQNRLPQSVASRLGQLQLQGVPLSAYQQSLEMLAKEGSIGSRDLRPLLACYQKLAGLVDALNRLQALQANNATTTAYADELKRGVISGVLSPEVAGKLMQEYAAMVTPVNAIPLVAETTLPGTEDFARLQQRLREVSAQGGAQPAAGQNGEQAAAQFAAAEAQAKSQADQARQQRIQQLQAQMTGQAQSLLAAWQVPRMQHVSGQAETAGADRGQKQGNATAGAAGGAANGQSGQAASEELPPLIKSGTIMFGVLDTAVDSDYPDTPVMVTIVQGPYKGATLLGKLSLAQGQDRVSLNFEQMDRDDWVRTKKINAFALDPDTARTVMASSVDHHYLLRYGSLFGASFLSGYASAISNAGTSSTVFGGSTTTHPELSPGNRIAVGLGAVGTQLSNTVQGYVNTPATVRIKSGVGVGILFVSDVT